MTTDCKIPDSDSFPRISRRTIHAYAALMWVLTAIFLLRVTGQAVQRWSPQPFLPAFSEFQGSDLPYWALLTAQMAILALMTHCCRRMTAGGIVPRPRTGFVLAWLGAIYTTVAVGRVGIGLLLESSPEWFSAWIPAALHVVLAAFVLTLAAYHSGLPRRHFLQEVES